MSKRKRKSKAVRKAERQLRLAHQKRKQTDYYVTSVGLEYKK